MKDHTYPIAETFYSLKGEGKWTGTPMFFIRFAGCNLSCTFCDTNFTKTREVSLSKLVEQARESEARHVVLTGGEPFLYPITNLAVALTEINKRVHVETNGTQEIYNVGTTWITTSPKSPISTLSSSIQLADEVKFLCGFEGWETYLQEVISKFRLSPRRQRFCLMPLAKSYEERALFAWDNLIRENIDKAVAYCLDHPEFSLCMQMHKICNIK